MRPYFKRTLFGESGKPLLVIGHKIRVGNGGSGEWSKILCLFPLPPGGGWGGVMGHMIYYVGCNMYVTFCIGCLYVMLVTSVERVRKEI